jgi:hypothetical protein
MNMLQLVELTLSKQGMFIFHLLDIENFQCPLAFNVVC